jgi:deazaflavin-dependent oxidoreductase (nitroreductase family)
MTFPRALARYTRGTVNTITLHLAGHAAFADLEHAGRKSGTVRHTPVRAFRAGDTVIISLNFGRQADWYQNIKAAGTCRMRLGGEQLPLGAPALEPVGQAAKDMPWLFSLALRHVVHTAECVRLPIVHSSPAPVTRHWHSHGRASPGAHPARAYHPALRRSSALPPGIDRRPERRLRALPFRAAVASINPAGRNRAARHGRRWPGSGLTFVIG